MGLPPADLPRIGTRPSPHLRAQDVVLRGEGHQGGDDKTNQGDYEGGNQDGNTDEKQRPDSDASIDERQAQGREGIVRTAQDCLDNKGGQMIRFPCSLAILILLATALALLAIDVSLDGTQAQLLTITGTASDTILEWTEVTDEDFLQGTSSNLTIDNDSIRLEPDLEFLIMNNGNPVLEPGTSSDWDSIIVYCTVVRDGAQYFMYYAGGKTVVTQLQIGLATSTDGIRWAKYSGNPILKYDLDAFDYYGLTTPQVIKDGNLWRMYYGGETRTSVDSYIDICYAYSDDGVNWTKYADNPMINHGTPKSTWDGRLAQPMSLARADNGTYLLYYRGKGTSEVSWLGLATSQDGVNWAKHPSNPLRRASTTGWEDDWFYGNYLDMANGTYRLWTTGDTSRHKIGYCTSDDGLTWTDSGAPVVLPEAGTAYSKGVSGGHFIDFTGHRRMYFRGEDDSNIYRFFVYNVTLKMMDGQYSSKTFDAGGIVRFDEIVWNAEIPACGNLLMSVRWANDTSQFTEWKRIIEPTDIANITASVMTI